VTNPGSNELFGSNLWEAALEKYASATHLTISLFDAGGHAVFGPVGPTPLFQLFDEARYDPGICAECARRCLAPTEERSAVLVSQVHGLAVVGASLMLEGRTVGAAVGGYAFVDFSQVSEIQLIAHKAGISFERLWGIARKQAPISQQRLIVQGELLQVLGDALLREYYRARQYAQAAAIVNSSDDAIIGGDLDGIITSWNGGAERLLGYAAREVLGQPLTLLMHRDGLADEQRILERVRCGESSDHYETVYQRKDRSPVEISLTASPVRDGNGRMTGVSRIARDISERKRYQNHRELLMHELNHRVKNTLATVQSFAVQTLRNAPSLGAGCESLEARLVALAKAHDALTNEHWEGADLGATVANAIAAYSGDAGGSRFRVTGPAVRLVPRAVLALSMALHELATNAVKYGALSTGSGHVEISWWLLPGGTPRFRLLWAESGGPPVETPRRRGFGSRLVEQGLAQDLDGEARLNFAPGGLVCTIEAPLDEIGSVKADSVGRQVSEVV
jgi:PAS domain S-box-containing protein